MNTGKMTQEVLWQKFVTY